jgi:PAS domain S-box-containing protein
MDESTDAALDILVVEDDEDARENLRDILELEGHRVAVAGLAVEVLRRGDLAKFPVIILDRRLPDATSDELLPTLRARVPEAAVVVVTGYSDLQGAVAALRQGASDYIVKPIDVDELRARIGRIAEARRAEAAKHAADRRYRLLVQASSDIITSLDARGTILYQSPSVGRLLGYPADGRIGRNIFTDPIAHPDDLPAKRAFLDDALRHPGVTVTGGFRLRHVDGSYRDFEAVGTNLLDDPDFGAIVASYRDVTTRRQAERALEVSEERFRLLVEAAECLIVILRPDLTIAYLSPFAEHLTGYAAREIIGREYVSLFVPEPYRGAVAEELTRSLEGRPTAGYENPIVGRDGVQRWLAWNARPLADFEGGPALMKIGQDITHLKRAQERALQAQRLAAIGQMIAGLAHESRNALQRSQACLEMLGRLVRDRPAAVDLIARLQKAQDQLHHLFEDVRAYAAPIRLERRPCDVAEVWREAWADLEPARRGRAASLVEAIPPPAALCSLDPFRLGQVFRNLFENALAAATGPLEIAIRCGPAEIDGAPAVRVTVRDNGPGLDAERRRRAFEPFFTTKTKGTGLGLAIARRVVEAHGGRIDVGDGEGPGAEFVITLPRGES